MTGKTIYTWATDQDDQYLYVDRDIEGRWSVTIYRGDDDYPQEVGSIRLPEHSVRALHEWLGRLLGLTVLCAPTCMAYGSVDWWWDCPRHGHAGPFDSFEDAAAHHARAGGGG